MNGQTAQGVILFGDRRALYRIAATGGSAVAVTTLTHQEEHRSPTFLPGGRQFLFVAADSREAQGVYLGSLDSSEPRRLLAVDAGDARYLLSSYQYQLYFLVKHCNQKHYYYYQLYC